jgi:Mrp family chromosome partitioning ATPase
VLQREAEKATGRLYESLLQRRERTARGQQQPCEQRPAARSREIAGPRSRRTPGRAWIMALLFGSGSASPRRLRFDYLDDTVKTPEDVTWRLHLNFLGLVPKVHGERHTAALGRFPRFRRGVRALRTALVASSGTDATQLVAITSTQPLEGKTTTAVNIALALAIGGARVLLIDADMRRPSLHKAMRLPNDRGLADCSAGKAKMREVVQRCGDPNLLVISGRSIRRRTRRSCSESDRMRRSMHQLTTDRSTGSSSIRRRCSR